MDLAISGSVLILLMPVFLPLVVLLACTGEGYVFYRQKRIGLKNTYFDILKFATMLKDSPNIGTGEITLRQDPRVTKVGRVLRKTKINELPQILNVLLGQMSIVGPRPLVDRTFNAYPEDIRHKVYASKPGITGIGSLVFRDEEALISASTLPPHEYYSQVIAPYKGDLEMWYLNRKSLGVDCVIIFLTAWSILFSKNQLVYRLFPDLPPRNF